MWLFWLILGMAAGVTFSETIRAGIRKISTGRAFGSAPASASKTDQPTGASPK